MKKIFILIIILAFVSLSCCKKWFIKDKEFTMSTIPYTGNELKIDGYYYKKAETDTNRFYVLVFYNNGIILKIRSEYLNGIEDIENRFCDPNYIKDLQDCLACWGPYQIENEVLKFEYYDIFGNNWHTCIAYCDIINDSTFNIKNATFSKTGKEVNVKEKGTNYYLLGEYHFKQFSPKPDSTNSVVP